MSKKPLEAGDFRVTMTLAKSYEKTNEGGDTSYFISGLASGTGLDHDGERMAETAIDAFKKAIDEGIVLPNGKWSYVPLRSGHRKEWDDVLGYITKANIDDEYNLWIEAELDDTSTTAMDLYRKLNQGDRPGKPLQLGLSVGGTIKKASHEWNAALSKRVRVIEDISLKEVSVVGQPAYPPSYVEALYKSVNWDELEENMTKDEKVAAANDTPDNETENAEKAQEVKQETTQEAQKTVETTDEKATEKAEAANKEEDANKNIYFSEDAADIRELVKKLQEQIDSLREALGAQKSLEQKVDEMTEKTKEEAKATETKIEKCEDDMTDKIVVGIAAAFEKFKTDVIEPMSKEITTMKASIDEMANEPVDKSLAVRQSKEGEDDAIEKFQKRVQEASAKGGRYNLIAESVRAAMGE